MLPAAQVFPGGDGATPELLGVDLAAQMKAWRSKHPNRKGDKRLVLHKSRRRLDVFLGDDLIKVYLVNLGYAPEGPKQIQGDMKTPEGHLFICAKNRQSQFVRFLELAYPGPEDVKRGLEAHQLSRQEGELASQAYQHRDRCPPQGTALGGAVGIHGGGAWEPAPNSYQVVDWTWGCVGLRTPDILELFNEYAQVGIPVDILAD